MTIGHPPPSSRCLRTRLTERLTYLDDLVRVRLDDFLASDQQPDAREAYKHQIQQYIAQARSLLATLPAEAGAPVDRVLMDVPVSVVDEETGAIESFTVVGPGEVDPSAGRISLLSPLGSALLLRRREETVVLDAPGGRFLYRVVVIGGDEAPPGPG